MAKVFLPRLFCDFHEIEPESKRLQIEPSMHLVCYTELIGYCRANVKQTLHSIYTSIVFRVTLRFGSDSLSLSCAIPSKYIQWESCGFQLQLHINWHIYRCLCFYPRECQNASCSWNLQSQYIYIFEYKFTKVNMEI